MSLKTVTLWLLAVGGAYLLLFYGMSDRGLVGPDEPRYASIAREMWRSGDWTTPRLDDEPWFEKPALLYWMGAAAAWLGIDDDRATRLPVAIFSVLFLLFFYWSLRNQFGVLAARYATLILATSAGWLAFSQTGSFDLPLAATLGAGLLSLLPWVEQSNARTRGRLPLFGALLGLSILAKGLVGPALAGLALLGVLRGHGPRSAAADLLHPRTWVPCLAVALPWYVLCYAANGSAFVDEFIWRHHVDRFLTGSLEHVQPFWYFVPVLLIGLLPWTPLLILLPRQALGTDPKARFLAVWAATTLIFFSVSTNKLPGYILPALPPLAALLGVGLAARRRAWVALVPAAFFLALLPLAADVLPVALARGLPKAWPPEQFSWLWPIGAAAVAASLGYLDLRQRRGAAVAVLGSAAALGFIYLKTATFPAIDLHAGTRALWQQVEPQLARTCLGQVRRHVRYGLDYYSAGRLPDCDSAPRPLQIENDPAALTEADGPEAISTP